MKRIVSLVTAIAVFIMLVSGTFIPIRITEVPYPEGFRDWTHVKTVVAVNGDSVTGKIFEFHSIYANAKAMQGRKSGKFADGTVFVFENRRVDTINGGYEPGAGILVDVMYKSTKGNSESGGWAFGEFKGNSKIPGGLTPARRQNCFKSCHQLQKEADYVFSKWDAR